MDDRIPAIILGVLFSVVNAVVTVYLALKDDNGITASGIIAGDILVGLALSLRSLL